MSSASVVWTSEAFSDLETIFDFIYSQSQSAAGNITKSILARAKQLENFPESGANQQTLHQKKYKYKYLVDGNYKIIYSHTKNIAYIHAVIDCRQDPYAINEKLT